MAIVLGDEVMVEKDSGTPGDEGSKKRNKQKGAFHALQWEILDNEDIKAEEKWEAEMEDFWTFKTCKKYVKMYHIDKLWPRECHQSHTRNFACRPWMCKNDHFIHRAEEVWRALFGDRPRSKGFFNYSLLSMVYAELILKRKVDWTTFPTTVQFPLRIGRMEKHIPDSYDPKSVLTMNILEFLKKRPHGAIFLDIVPTKTERSGNCSPKGSELAIQIHVPSSGGIQTPGECLEDVIAVPESKEKMDNMVDNILSTMFPKSLLNDKETKVPTHSTSEDTILEGDKDIVTPKQGDKNVDGAQTNVSKMKGVETDAGPSTAVPLRLEQKFSESMSLVDTISCMMEMLKTMPNKDELKELLDFTMQWAKLGAEKTKEGNHGSNEEAVNQGNFGKFREVLEIAYNVKQGATILSAMVLDFVEMAKVFANVTPSMVEAALGMEKLTSTIKPLLEERVENLRIIMELEAEAKKRTSFTDELIKELEQYKMKQTLMASKGLAEIHSAKKKTINAEVCEVEVVQLDSDIHTTDNLSLSQYKQPFRVDVITKSGEGTSKPPCVEVVQEIGYSQVQSEPRGKEKAKVQEGEDVEAILQKLEVANKERDEARAELLSLRKTLTIVDYTPKHENTMPWLGWIHRLHDRETMVSKAAHSLKKYAAESKEACELVEASIQRFKNIIGESGSEPTKITVWGDTIEMMDRTNHYRKGKSNDIDWTLEVEEGWVPFNIFSSHFVEAERTVIHTCDPKPSFLNDTCSLCQEQFGPKGAYTMGQCRHNFHITCISESAMRQSVCPTCRSPISMRFYEMMGLRHVMPPGHEFNRWNLPLDQLPKKFLNYREWGKPLIWNTEFSCHQLYEEYGMECDPFFWMTQDYEVEVRAREIEDAEQRELFCHNFEGHWSTEHKRFFRFPPKKVEKGDGGSWHEVDDNNILGEEYNKYNRTLIRRALFLARLEEAAKLQSTMVEASFKDVGCCYWDAVHAFDKRIGDIINYWRSKIQKPHEELLILFQENDEFVTKVVGRIAKAMEIFAAKRVDPGRKRKRDDGSDSDDSWESEMVGEIAAIDREYEEGGRIARPSQRPQTRSRTRTEGVNEG